MKLVDRLDLELCFISEDKVNMLKDKIAKVNNAIEKIKAVRDKFKGQGDERSKATWRKAVDDIKKLEDAKSKILAAMEKVKGNTRSTEPDNSDKEGRKAEIERLEKEYEKQQDRTIGLEDQANSTKYKPKQRKAFAKAAEDSRNKQSEIMAEIDKLKRNK